MSVTGASERNSSTTTSSVNERGKQPSSSSAATAGSDSANRDYVNIDELLEDIAGNDGDGDCDEQGDGIGAEDAKIFENIANRMDQDDILFGNPKWLENFKEMKQVAIDLLYKDILKHWTALRFNLQLLIQKSLHGWSDTSFNDLLRMLADTYLEDDPASVDET